MLDMIDHHDVPRCGEQPIDHRGIRSPVKIVFQNDEGIHGAAVHCFQCAVETIASSEHRHTQAVAFGNSKAELGSVASAA